MKLTSTRRWPVGRRSTYRRQTRSSWQRLLAPPSLECLSRYFLLLFKRCSVKLKRKNFNWFWEFPNTYMTGTDYGYFFYCFQNTKWLKSTLHLLLNLHFIEGRGWDLLPEAQLNYDRHWGQKIWGREHLDKPVQQKGWTKLHRLVHHQEQRWCQESLVLLQARSSFFVFFLTF